eukprot:283358_1
MTSGLSHGTVNTKTIQRTNPKCIDQLSWTKLLIRLDLKISNYYNKSDVILISTPYSIENAAESLSNAMHQLNLACICPIIMEHLFGYEIIKSKLKFIATINILTIKQLLHTMSIIIIDIHSSQMIKIPTHSSDVFINPKKCNNDWKIRWSTDKTKTCVAFRNIMSVICNEFEHNQNIMKYFSIYTGQPPPVLNHIKQVRTAIYNMEKREVYLEGKIEIYLQKAKHTFKKGDKKGALDHLKQKKELQKQLETIQCRKYNLTFKETIFDEMIDEIELECELAELNNLECDEIELECELAELDISLIQSEYNMI